MTPKRPLKNLSDEELMNLWDEAQKVSVIGSKDFDYRLLGMSDVRNLRAEIMLLAALCEKYNLEYPTLKQDCLFVDWSEIDEDDEESFDEPLEYMTEPLHRYIDAFSDVGGIGDFKTESMFDPVEVAADIYNNKKLCGVTADEITAENISEQLDGLLTDELEFSGYRALVAMVMESGEPEYYFSCQDISSIRSKQLGRLLTLSKEEGKLSKRITDFLDEFAIELSRGSYFTIMYDDMYEIVNGEYVGIAAVIQYCEDEVWTCSLHKNMFNRIGAHIVSELAERY